MNKRVMNLVNFVRGCEPRCEADLYTPVIEEIRIDKEFGMPHTFLLQYDALLRPDFRELFLKEADENMELGLWFEMNRQLTEKVGVEWRGRPGYDWDWYVNPGFLPAYTPAQREALIDEAFRLFREIFGYYPQVAGSWLLDSHSMAYMSDKYDMKAFCICREQLAVDAYTLLGGYYSGGYYPSRNNMICPAQTEEATIKTPVYRMLGIDPLYGLDIRKYAGDRLGGCPTMEPVWGPGSSSDVMDWYFRTYYENPCLAQAHATTGQENSFGWHCSGPGYLMQIEKLDKLVKEGKVVVEKLGDTGAAMQATTPVTPACALVALEDWAHDADDAEHQCRSIWYSCKNYRANLFSCGKKLFFRDVQKYDDRYIERYAVNPCTTWDATYDNLPMVDNLTWSQDGIEAGIVFDGEFADMSAAEVGNDLEVVASFADGHKVTVLFTENGFTVTGCDALHYVVGTPKPTIDTEGNVLVYKHNGYDYRIPTGGVVKTAEGYDIVAANGAITVDMTDR